jgi:hypothetical protein
MKTLGVALGSTPAARPGAPGASALSNSARRRKEHQQLWEPGGHGDCPAFHVWFGARPPVRPPPAAADWRPAILVQATGNASPLVTMSSGGSGRPDRAEAGRATGGRSVKEAAYSPSDPIAREWCIIATSPLRFAGHARRRRSRALAAGPRTEHDGSNAPSGFTARRPRSTTRPRSRRCASPAGSPTAARVTRRRGAARGLGRH